MALLPMGAVNESAQGIESYSARKHWHSSQFQMMDCHFLSSEGFVGKHVLWGVQD